MSEDLKAIKEKQRELISSLKSVRYWCQDESRFGLITLTSRKITLTGVKPIGIEQWKYDYFWLYGLVEPRTGD